jgi:hypothetical protein
MTLNGDPHACIQHKAKVLFLCPKMCGFCDTDSKTGKEVFCEDFYLMKCPTWKEQGMCTKTDRQFGVISEVCRKSCGVCTPHYMKPAGSSDAQGKEKQGGGGGSVVPPVAFISPPVLPPKPADVMQNVVDINPGIVHKQYLANKISDTFTTQYHDHCALNDRPDGLLLARVKVHEEYNPLSSQYSIVNKIRLFCGIYTMKKNHESNVKATRNTWAKKCDGFIAFSTERDETIPSIALQHEGEESYDNMWQKSRSIWKLLYEQYRDHYDFFLLGGDDMFYIIENLRYYLNSAEITKERNERPG